MESNPRLTKIIYEVLDNQLRANDPPETRATYKRLLAEGQPLEEARRLVASVIALEMFAVLEEQREFDSEGFVKALNALPHEPWEDQ